MKYTEAMEAVKPYATLENALKWEAGKTPEEKDKVCCDAMGIEFPVQLKTDEFKLVDALGDKLCDIIQSQRNLRALGMGTAPLNSQPVKKVEAHKACQRCGGTGIVAQYKHLNGGLCYGCGGTGKNRKYH